MMDEVGASGRQSLVHLAARMAFVATLLSRTGARRAADDLRALCTQILALVDTSLEGPRAALPAGERSSEAK